MHITKVLENEVGLQFDRVKDNTGSTGAAPINGVITGSFKRGRIDQQMQITQDNIKAVLGYDPENPDYVAVQDALNTGIPYVNVMRIVNSKLSVISCAGASSSAIIDYDPSLSYKVTINNEVVLNINKIDLNASGQPELNPYTEKLLNLVDLQGILSSGTESWGALDFSTISYNDNLRISVEAFRTIYMDGGGQENNPAFIFFPRPQESNNQTIFYENREMEHHEIVSGYSKVSFCLSPPV
ncbi:hypothetical protein DJ533_00345 (plasmid) [Acinetobacter defluvii]|uniref:Uncharacterized protein n=1 Tax=Acinetobacter defluvii TaxID=1871111 RepID=A0A2S2F8D5_9GAMM|nr:hypothetical protein [Acinetobacter defluvii]AWL27168.1 hypothetical protein DJ533_00345 [Acinetobacter defluvii]